MPGASSSTTDARRASGEREVLLRHDELTARPYLADVDVFTYTMQAVVPVGYLRGSLGLRVSRTSSADRIDYPHHRAGTCVIVRDCDRSSTRLRGLGDARVTAEAEVEACGVDLDVTRWSPGVRRGRTPRRRARLLIKQDDASFGAIFSAQFCRTSAAVDPAQLFRRRLREAAARRFVAETVNPHSPRSRRRSTDVPHLLASEIDAQFCVATGSCTARIAFLLGADDPRPISDAASTRSPPATAPTIEHCGRARSRRFRGHRGNRC
jgi:hypothetical protein